MYKKHHARVIGLGALVLAAVSPGAGAASFQTLTLPSNVNYWAGPNQLGEFGLGDDVVFDAALQAHPSNQMPGPLNPLGSTLSFHVTNPETLGLSANGLALTYATGLSTLAQPQATFGVNTWASVDFTNTTNNVFDPYVDGSDIDSPAPGATVPLALNDPGLDSELVPGQSSTMTLNPDNTFSNDVYTRWQGGGFGFIFHAQTNGWYLVKGQVPATVFAGNPSLVGFLDFIVNSLDATNPNWTVITGEVGTIATLDETTLVPTGQLTLVSGASFSEDPGAAPVPLPAGLYLLGGALAALCGRGHRRAS